MRSVIIIIIIISFISDSRSIVHKIHKTSKNNNNVKLVLSITKTCIYNDTYKLGQKSSETFIEMMVFYASFVHIV